jgi:2'-5' RNA ligase
MDYITFIAKKEEIKPVHKFGCAIVYFDFPEIKDLHSRIDQEHIHHDEDGSKGLEDEPHVTLLYGLHPEVQDNEVIEASKCKYDSITLHNLSLFENEKCDVLKFDAKGDSLHEANGRLSKLPHTTDYPDYHPHCTVAYLKPGKGREILEKLKDVNEYEVKCKHIVYSKIDGTKIKEDIK